MPSLRSAWLAVAVAISPAARADETDPVIVRVGDEVQKAADVVRRLAAIPKYQLATFGGTPEAMRKRFLEVAIVPEMLYAAEGSREKLADRPEVRARIRDARSRALVDQIRKDIAAAGVPDDELRGYFDAHHDEFQKPERIRIQRILTEDESVARKILSDARGAGGPERWVKLAREHSVDEATKMRGGSLGFVFPDGRTEVPQLKVDSALYAAAATVKDGELVAEPVKEGPRFAVVWRRGTLPKVDRSLEDEREHIREILLRARVDRAIQSLLDTLRKQFVSSVAPDLLEAPLPGETPAASAPVAARASASSDPLPRPTDRGLR